MMISRDGGRSFERLHRPQNPPLPGANIERNIKDISYSLGNPQAALCRRFGGLVILTRFTSPTTTGENWKLAPLSGLPAVKDAHLSQHKASTVAVSPR